MGLVKHTHCYLQIHQVQKHTTGSPRSVSIPSRGVARFTYAMSCCGGVNGLYLCRSNDGTRIGSYGLRPVVALKSEVALSAEGALQ